MKVYEKPRLVAMSLSGNDQLCGSCASGITIHNNQSILGDLSSFVGDLNGDGEFNRTDVEILFDDKIKCGVYCDMYCKFTSTGDKIVAWS